jgi:Domain of unknown function (DUF4833)
MRPLPLASSALVLVSFALVAPIARPAGPEPGRSVGSVFFVGKSENRNEVHYGVALDRDCVPAGPSPVFAYWRMRERGPLATEPLLSREVAAYGIAEPQRTSRGEHGGRVVFRLNAMPKRMIAIDTAADGEGCSATARAMIRGTAAALTSVFVQLRWPFGVDYLLLSGRAANDGSVVRERLER